jgi:hypothetical protein
MAANVTPADPSTVSLRTGALYALRIWAQESRPDLAAQIETVVVNRAEKIRTVDAGYALVSAEKTCNSTAVIPFHRSAFDTACVALSMPLSGGAHALYSDDSAVEAGFMLINSHSSRYVGDGGSLEKNSSDRPPSTLLDGPADHLIRKLLRSKRDRTSEPSIRVSTDSPSLLQIHLGKAVPARGSQNDVQVDLTLMVTGDGGEQRQQTIRKAKLRRVSKENGAFNLEGVAPGSLMELHAASVAGAWIEIRGESIRLLGKLPDIGDDASAHPLLWDPLDLWDRLKLKKFVQVPRPLANALISEFPWVASEAPTDWYLGAVTPSASPPNTP